MTSRFHNLFPMFTKLTKSGGCTYVPQVNVGRYCVVLDKIVEDIPKAMFQDRPWGPGDNLKIAVWEYLKTHSDFEIDKCIDHKLLISVAPDGYLKRVK